MKKLIYHVIFLLIILVSTKSYSQNVCVAPEQQGQTEFTIDGCLFAVTFCYTYFPTGELTVRVIYISHFPNDQRCDSIMKDPFFHYKAREHEEIIIYLAAIHALPPCGASGGGLSYHEYTIHEQICWKMVNQPLTQTCILLPCNEYQGECISIYRVCMDYSVEPHKMVMTLVNQYATAESECPLQVQIPPVGKTWGEPWISDCYMIGC